MNCLSSEDLKEERNYSLTYKPTLNLGACPVYVAVIPYGYLRSCSGWRNIIGF